jgi:uncharacterized protein (TIGR00645 family)
MVERLIERVLFASRWLLAPLYLGLALVLVIVAIEFFRELVHAVPALPAGQPTDTILMTLSLVDLVLVANLVVMVMLSGYENFISRLDVVTAEKNLAWLGKLDAGSLKLKLATAIVAISAINLLRAFMDAAEVADDKLLWLVIIHLTFVASAMMLTLMDRWTRESHSS